MSLPHSPSAAGADGEPTATRLSNSWNVSPEVKRSRTVIVAAPEKVHGGASAATAVGFVAGLQPTGQSVPADPAPRKPNSRQVPSTVIGPAEAVLAERTNSTKTPKTTIRVPMSAPNPKMNQ